ncbi:portal protein [Vibrio phage PhiImVa-1]|nr:portal protein [Vibrio phage PhiImVa-1]
MKSMNNDFSAPKLTKWKNEPSVTELRQDYTSASSAQSEQVGKIEKWLSLLNVTGSQKVKPRPGRSTVQPKLIRKQAEWRYASLSEPFLSNDDIFEVSPKTWLDREAARQNSLVLNYQFNNQLNRTTFIDNLIRTLVNEGTAIVRVSWDYEEGTRKEVKGIYDYEEADMGAAQMISQAVAMVEANPAVLDTFPEQLQESVKASQLNGRPIQAFQKDTEVIEVVHAIKNQPAIEICDYRNVIIDPTCAGDMTKANFVIYSYEASRSDLERTGLYENLELIEDEDGNDGNHTELGDTSFRFGDKPRKKLTVYEYWGYWDIDDSGITKPIVATWVGDVMIRMEENPYPDGKIPFVVIPYLPVKESVYGEADAELLEDNQKLIGALTRGQIDAMARSANAQIGMRKDALDSLNLRKFKAGEDYMFNPGTDPRAAVIEHTYPELPASTFNLLQMFNMEAEAITGIKSFAGGLSGDALGSTATGVQGVIDAQSKRELGILRRVANGMVEIAKKILAMNSQWLSDEEVIRITDEEFVQINRDNLVGSFDIKLTISNSQTDNIKAQELSFMLQTMGGVLPFNLLQIILAQIADLRNMPDLAKLIKDYQPEPDPLKELEAQKTQLEMQKLQAEIAKLQAEANMAPVKAQAEQAKARKLSTEADLNSLDFVEQESGVKQERELELMKAQAEGNLARDISKTILDTQTKNKEKPND